MYLSIDLSTHLKFVNRFPLVGCFSFFLSFYAYLLHEFSWFLYWINPFYWTFHGGVTGSRCPNLVVTPRTLFTSCLCFPLAGKRPAERGHLCFHRLSKSSLPEVNDLYLVWVLHSWENMKTREAWNQRGWPAILPNIWMMAEWGMASNIKLQ